MDKVVNYAVINIPREFKGDDIIGDYINKFDKGTAIKYFQWYMSIKNERIIVLEKAIKSTHEFSQWNANLSVESLGRLQMWFERNVEKKPATENEKRKFMAQFSGVWEIVMNPLEWVLTKQTESLCHDIGIYFAEVLMKHNNNLHWGQDLTHKRSPNFNYPQLLGGKNFEFNPYKIAHVSALKALDGEKNDWLKLFNFWDSWAKQNIEIENKN